MPVKININKAAVRRHAKEAWDKVLPTLSEEVLKDCNYYAKEDTGALIASSQIASRLAEGTLTWSTPYAARQYYEIRTASHDQNPNATWRWCEAAKRKYKEKWRKQAEKLMEENL